MPSHAGFAPSASNVRRQAGQVLVGSLVCPLKKNGQPNHPLDTQEPCSPGFTLSLVLSQQVGFAGEPCRRRFPSDQVQSSNVSEGSPALRRANAAKGLEQAFREWLDEESSRRRPFSKEG